MPAASVGQLAAGGFWPALLEDTGVTAAGVTDVLERFPDHAPLIRKLAVSDTSFRAICDDYATAAAALRRWEASTDTQSRERQAEYRYLLESLEGEVREVLGLT